MTDCTQGAVAEVEAVITSSAAAAAGVIKFKLARLWPLAILGLGLFLTVAWNAGLFWLLYSVV
jgi:hypothetical protein